MKNRETLIFEALGEVSMCWTPTPSTQVFDSTKAKEIGEKLVKDLNSLDKANLGLAKTSELIYELSARCDTGSIDKGGDYRTVDSN